MKNSIRYVVLLCFVVLPLLIIKVKPINLGLDLKGGSYIVLQADVKDQKLEHDTMDKVRDIVERRIDALGLTEPNIQKSGEDRIIVELAGINDTKEAVNLIGTTAKLEFRIQNPDGTLGEVLLTGDKIKNATVVQDALGQSLVSFELNDEGTEIFAKITRENVNKQLAIVLDGVVQVAPKIEQEITGGKGQISGYDTKGALDVVNLLKSGSLPVDIRVLETRTVGATLGVSSIAQTKFAGVIALALISIFMFIFYKIPGIVADIVLCIYGVMVLASLVLMNATLTLPGIAGLILSLGMAVDANVIVFERMKEELKQGKTLDEILKDGFGKSFSAIIDGNMIVLLITIILFIFGTGPVRGFAITLGVGTILTLITALFISKEILALCIKIFKLDKNNLFWKGVK